ncbi:hypothetical protein Bbelb_279610 [Branchiostoma belcheri]|nr:hypothetical protein Bbelb_279610 [Branchiostoma belcheri]
MTYGSETWALTSTQMEMLRVAQRKMERIMLGITLRDRKRNSWIRLQTGVTDIITAVNTAKHRWAGHVARLQDNRWTLRATEWTPREWRRRRGRPCTRWRDSLVQHLGPAWPRYARLRREWNESREGFLRRSDITLD